MVREKEAKISTLVYVVVAIGLCCIHVPLAAVGIYEGCPFSSRLLYPFFHANIWHCLLNCWCLLSLAFLLDIGIPELALSYLVAVFVPVGLWSQSVPVVGFSGAFYCICGMLTFKVRTKWRWLLWWSFFIGVGFFFSQNANFLHLWCFAVGIVIGFLNSPVK